jgi:fumarylacetoacetate (FAA) hydrolase family protein
VVHDPNSDPARQARALAEQALRAQAEGSNEEADRLFSEAQRLDPDAVATVLNEHDAALGPPDARDNPTADHDAGRVRRIEADSDPAAYPGSTGLAGDSSKAGHRARNLIEHFRPPEDGFTGTWVGRAWVPGPGGGPAVVVIRPEGVFDVSRHVATMSALCDVAEPAAYVRGLAGERIGDVEGLLRNSCAEHKDPAKPWLLAPVDLQAIKAAGVTFAASLVERIVEESAKGDPSAANEVRESLTREIGADLSKIVPGSAEAENLRRALVRRGLWSQYLEVGIGPDAEVFTKAQPMSAVGYGAEIGVHPKSAWSNPEPEIVLVVSSTGRIVGATLGNDVNLRDFEGRSALLLSKAKDNNASTSLGPFVRLFDSRFSLDDVRRSEVVLHVEGEDGFVLDGVSAMSQISRDPEDLVAQTIGPNHQYPDGFVLFLGTMFAPTQAREGGGGGFTHKTEDVVAIWSAKLGSLVNRVRTSDEAPPWEFGIRALIANLAERGLVNAAVSASRSH